MVLTDYTYGYILKGLPFPLCCRKGDRVLVPNDTTRATITLRNLGPRPIPFLHLLLSSRRHPDHLEIPLDLPLPRGYRSREWRPSHDITVFLRPLHGDWILERHIHGHRIKPDASYLPIALLPLSVVDFERLHRP